MTFKFKLKGALSYSGIVSANARSPFVLAETEEQAEAIRHTGYFEELEMQTDSEKEYTKTALKKLNADQQKEVIVSLGGDPETTGNEDERINLILQLQAAGE